MKNEAKSSSNNNNDVDLDDEDDSKIFPQRLMSILSDERNQEAICWLPHGRSFIVRNRKLFAETVMCRYFSRKAKYSSFTRKLNRWYVLLMKILTSRGWLRSLCLCNSIRSNDPCFCYFGNLLWNKQELYSCIEWSGTRRVPSWVLLAWQATLGGTNVL